MRNLFERCLTRLIKSFSNSVRSVNRQQQPTISCRLILVLAIGIFSAIYFGSTKSLVAQERIDEKAFLSDPFSSDNHHFYRNYVDATNRKLSHQLEGAQRTRAIADACELYIQMEMDQAVANSEFLTGRKRKLHAILRRVKKSLEREVRMAERSIQSSSAANSLRPAVHPQTLASTQKSTPQKSTPQKSTPQKSTPQKSTPLASTPLDPLGAPNQGATEVQNDVSEGQSGEAARYNTAAHGDGPLPADLHMDSRNWEMGYRLEAGPAQVLVRAGGAAVGDASHLIQLIQTTITPEAWDVNGGTASIGYYQRVHALVIRAPWTTHNSTQRLLKRFRE